MGISVNTLCEYFVHYVLWTPTNKTQNKTQVVKVSHHQSSFFSSDGSSRMAWYSFQVCRHSLTLNLSSQLTPNNSALFIILREFFITMFDSYHTLSCCNLTGGLDQCPWLDIIDPSLVSYLVLSQCRSRRQGRCVWPARGSPPAPPGSPAPGHRCQSHDLSQLSGFYCHQHFLSPHFAQHSHFSPFLMTRNHELDKHAT